LFSSIYIF